jgi:membrane protein implicated in regulation of membrane protease activity
MLAAYLISAIVGGVLVTLSIVAGADGHDAGGHGGDIGDDGGAEAAQGGLLDGLSSWLPIASLRFWTFFVAFFGLTGTAMTVLATAGPLPVAVAATAVGYASGILLTRTMSRLQRTSSNSSLAEADLVGATAQVLLPIGAGRTGKVRLHVKDRSVDLLAETEEEPEIAAGEQVLVIATPVEGHVVVARIGKLS